MIENLVEITVDQLLAEVQKCKYEGYRFITATSADNGDGTVDVIYHFDKDYVMKNYRVTVGKEDSVPSISKIFFCALLVENEIKELFGVKITDIAIDYGGHMLLSQEEIDSPMLRSQITIEQKGGNK
jgi:Ni,Fe-hydrogenase III component G